MGGLRQNLGALALAFIFAASGAIKLQDPAPVAKQILAGSLPWVLNENKLTKLSQFVPGFVFGEKEAVILAQVTGALMAFAALMIIVNLGRRVFAFLLVGLLGAVTVFQHINLKAPEKTTMDNQIHCLKNLAIIGGLIYVWGTDESAPDRLREIEVRGASGRKLKPE
jgi:uncharacterized membrane protein YphA (DoxX/SURF4 family)